MSSEGNVSSFSLATQYPPVFWEALVPQFCLEEINSLLFLAHWLYPLGPWDEVCEACQS